MPSAFYTATTTRWKKSIAATIPLAWKKRRSDIGYEEFRAAQFDQRKRGVRLGIGIAAYVEGTGFGPYEGGSVKVGTNGKIYVFTGAASQGQGQETALGQICADYLGVDFKNVDVVTGDSAGCRSIRDFRQPGDGDGGQCDCASIRPSAGTRRWN